MPRAGRPVRGSRTGRPIMALLDLLGRRWSLRILWELHTAGPLGFGELQARCDGMSPSVLAQRLAELREAGLVALAAERYAPGADAAELARILLALDAWAKRWARRKPACEYTRLKVTEASTADSETVAASAAKAAPRSSARKQRMGPATSGNPASQPAIAGP